MPDRKAQWGLLIAQGLVDETPDIDNYNPDDKEYQVDHEPDISINWNKKGGGHDKDDDYRKDYVINDANLRITTKKFNLGKPKEEYNLWVGKNFESDDLDSPLKSKTIGGKPFLDAEDGNPIA
jgi:hypothetical protein